MNETMTRREALAALGLLAVAGEAALAAEAKKKGKRQGKGQGKGKKGGAAAGGAAKGGIALQLYTMREPAKADLAGTLKKCREMGWEYVQWSGMPTLPAEKIREELDKAGLKMIACHTDMESFEKDFDATVKFWKTCGCNDVAPGGMMKDCTKDLQGWLKGCARLDAIGAKLKDVGMRLSYHNHSGEFEKFPDDPRYKLDILFETTKNVNMELDIAWVLNAGVDPAAYVRKCKGRCPVIHVKDIIAQKEGKKSQFKPLGQGEVNWKEVFPACKEAGVEWYVYEQDGGEGSPFDYTKVSYDFLKQNVQM